MIYHDRIDFSEGIGGNKTKESQECDICHYWYFLNKDLQFQSNVCNRCYYLLVMYMKLSGIDLLNIKGADYYCVFREINKSEAINLRKIPI